MKDFTLRCLTSDSFLNSKLGFDFEIWAFKKEKQGDWAGDYFVGYCSQVQKFFGYGEIITSPNSEEIVENIWPGVFNSPVHIKFWNEKCDGPSKDKIQEILGSNWHNKLVVNNQGSKCNVTPIEFLEIQKLFY